MAIEIIDLTHRVGRIQIGIPGIAATEITEAEGVEVLEHLARILGFTLIDREERRELLDYAAELDTLQNASYGGMAEAVIAFANYAKATAEAINSTFRTDDPQEV